MSSLEIASMETASIFEEIMINNSVSLRMTERFPVSANAEILRPIIEKVSFYFSNLLFDLCVCKSMSGSE